MRCNVKNTKPFSKHLYYRFDKALTSFLRRVFDLSHCTTVKTLFLKKHIGGIGILYAVNKNIRSIFKDIITNVTSQTVWNWKLGIVSKHNNEVIIIDVACPYDLYIANIYKEKLENYCCIKSALVNIDLKCKIEVMVIGSLCTVHEKSLNVLLNCGMSKVSAKRLIRWCATPNVIAAKNIWKLRYKVVNRASSK